MKARAIINPGDKPQLVAGYTIVYYAGINYTTGWRSAPGEFLVFNALRQHSVIAEAALLVLFIILEISLEPLDVTVALERENMGGDAV